MKAIVLEETGNYNQLKWQEVPTPSAGHGEVVIKLKTAALNRRDLMVISGNYPGTKLPVILGSDGAGKVVETGNHVKTFQVGDEVIINPGLGWGDNTNVKHENFTILGMPQDGTFAQYIKITEDNVVPKPDHLTWEEAAALPLSGLTAYRAMITKGNVQPNETVLIPGAGGGVASYMIQFAHAKGANVYVTSSKDEKIKRAIALGAEGGVNYTHNDWVTRLHEITGGIDLTVDSIGGENFKALIELGKIGSRIVNFGATRGPIPNLILPTMTLKEMSIIGSTMGSPKDFNQMVQLITDYNIRPIIEDIQPITSLPTALKSLEKGEGFGKIVMTIPHDE